MSVKRYVNAKMTGYDGPVFPANILKFNQAKGRVTFKDQDYGRMAKAMERRTNHLVSSTNLVQTSDGYHWCFGLVFDLAAGKVLVLFPWSQDWKEKSRVRLDRSIAFYTVGKVPPEEIENISIEFVIVLGEEMVAKSK